jgi:two-component system, NtrC family, sensor histidine kinase PilS
MRPGSEAYGAVRGLILVRAGVTTLLAGSVSGAYVAGRLPFPLPPVLTLVAATYLLTAFYLGLLARIRHPARFAELQIYGDLVLETLLVYLTGGPYSVFPFIYLLSILAASIVVAPRQSFVVATASVLLHGSCLAGQLFGWLPPTTRLAGPPDLAVEGSLTILLISGNFCASYTVAYGATYLAGRLRQARGEVRRSEASLAELQVLHEDIVQSVASGLLTFDRAGIVTTVNRTAETLCRRGAPDLHGVRWGEVFDGAPSFGETWEVLSRRGRHPFRFEARLLREDRSLIAVGVSASFLRRELGVICSFQDLTEIKRMEARVRHADRLAAIGRFAAGLAHEIRNPIGAIRGSVEVLRESLRPQADDRRLMDIVLRESDRLDGIIRDFLDFSRPQRLVRMETDLVGVVEEILLLLANRAPTTIRMVRDFPEATVKASVDPAQMRQAVWNLCLNAVEAMPDGGELRMRVRTLPEGSTVEIGVHDTGVGIALADRSHLFEPFFTTKPHGTGLGLAIVHRIAEDHGGEVRVESEPGVGTSFALLLPVDMS